MKFLIFVIVDTLLVDAGGYALGGLLVNTLLNHGVETAIIIATGIVSAVVYGGICYYMTLKVGKWILSK